MAAIANMTRRWFLKTLGILGLSWLLPGTSFPGTFTGLHTKDLNALAEGIMPGATDAGVHIKLERLYSGKKKIAGIFSRGLWAVERHANNNYKRPFYQLNKKEKDSVLKWLDSAPSTSREQIFFTTLRRAVMEYYYTSPVTWKMLNYKGPPQPKGFRDYYLPPRDKNA